MPDELLDVVNMDDTIISTAMRSHVHREGLLHRGVHVFLFNKQGQLLTQQRSRQCHPFPFAFDCSISEHVKAGESYRQAAVRGLKEELGVAEIRLQPLVKFNLVYGLNDNEISTLFEGVFEHKEVRLDPQEVEAIYYYRLRELDTLIERGEPEFCGWFEELLNWYLGKPSNMNIIKHYAHSHTLNYANI